MEEITLAGLFVVVFGIGAKTLFDWFKQRNLQDSDQRLKSLEKEVKELKEMMVEHDKGHGDAFEKVKELHEWHDRRDADGVPVWYVRKSLEDIIKQNADAVTMLAQQGTMQTQLLKELAEAQKDILVEMRRMHTQPLLPTLPQQ